MTQWSAEELTRIADVDEMHIAGRRRDGTDRYTGPVASITSQLARSATLKIVPQQEIRRTSA